MERERDGRSARRARGVFAQHPRQAGDVAEQQEDGLPAGTLDLDVAVPGACMLEPRRDARVDTRVLEVLEQLSYGLGRSVGGEAEPPVLVGPREIEEALICGTSRPPPPNRAGERLTHLRLAGQARQQARERLRLLGFERQAPHTLVRIP